MGNIAGIDHLLTTAGTGGATGAGVLIIVRGANDIRGVFGRSAATAAYEIPGGRTEPGETARQTAVREFAEEVGMAAADMKTLAAHIAAHENYVILIRGTGAAARRFVLYIVRMDSFDIAAANAAAQIRAAEVAAGRLGHEHAELLEFILAPVGPPWAADAAAPPPPIQLRDRDAAIMYASATHAAIRHAAAAPAMATFKFRAAAQL